MAGYEAMLDIWIGSSKPFSDIRSRTLKQENSTVNWISKCPSKNKFATCFCLPSQFEVFRPVITSPVKVIRCVFIKHQKVH